MSKTPTTLIIMDGFGISPCACSAKDNAIEAAKTPYLDKVLAEFLKEET